MKLLISFLISLLVWLPIILISYPIVSILLLTKWSGKTTWFGNYLHGRGTTHYTGPTNNIYWKEWVWLCLRNPVSNFGKFVLSVSKDNTWAWLEDKQIIGSFYIKYGWKLSDERLPDAQRTFIFRPWIHK